MRKPLMAMVSAVILMMPGTAQAEERPWREVPLPTFWPHFAITHVAGAGPNEAWIAGYERQQCVPLPLPRGTKVCTGNAIVRKWNGTQWENKNPPGLWKLAVTGLQASSPTNVWLTGGNNYLAHWDGSRWSRIASPAGCYDLNFYQIRALGADEFLAPYLPSAAGGVSCVARWKAGTWQVHKITGQSIQHVGSTGPGEIIISTVAANDSSDPATYRYTGSTWEPLPTPPSHPNLVLTGPGARYYRTWGGQRNLLKVTIAGTEAIPAAPEGAGTYLLDDLDRLWARNADTLYRYDGTAWQTVPTGLALPQIYDWTSVPNSQGVLWAVAGTTATTDGYRSSQTLTND